MKNLVAEGAELCVKLVRVAKKALLARKALAHLLPIQTYYLGMVDSGVIEFCQGDLRLRAPNGAAFDFPEDQWRSYLFEETQTDSYAKPVFLRASDGKTVSFRVGPLARINCCDRIDTPLAGAELQQFRELEGSPCHQTVMYHYARLIELLYAVEKISRLILDDEFYSDNIRTAPTGEPQSSTAVVEAPRGVLIHDYKVDKNGIVTDANLLVATQMNVSAINRTIGIAARQYLDQPDDLLLNAIEFGVRCYDPCLSCATHRLGELKMEAVIRRQGKVIRRARR
jgi:F420-non-reducing hydrogenase large subunit